MISITNPSNCCGCTACFSVCAHNAITMRPNALGFQYPFVDETKCVDCGLCDKVCAFNDKYDTTCNIETPDVYGARHKNPEEVRTSRSGAAFIAFSDWILDNGGVVYGAGYTEHFIVSHKRAKTKEERNEFKESKYVQSDLGQCYRQVKQDLRKGIKVLFSGTPCQTAGLHSYVGKKYSDNLFLIDIVCHGVPSPYIWRDYLRYLERKNGSIITSVSFRDKKKFGWAAHRESFCFDGREIISKTGFTFLFYKNIMLRPSCGNCHYCNSRRPSDITIADFWGWQKTDPDINKDDKGISLIFCNTEKGRDWFDSIKSSLIYIPAKLDNVLQPNLQHPSAMHPKRMQFEKDYAHKGFEYVYYKYGEDGWRYKLYSSWRRLVRTIKGLLPS